MSRYVFQVVITGFGNNPDEAWDDTVEGFSLDPGCIPDEDTYTLDEEEDE